MHPKKAPVDIKPPANNCRNINIPPETKPGEGWGFGVVWGRFGFGMGCVGGSVSKTF